MFTDRRNSNVLDVQSFKGADCDTDLYLVVAKPRERLAASKRRTNKFYMGKFSLKNLN
jgi:hypothetical protein